MAATLGNGNITFGDSTTQSTAALPLTGGTLTGALSGTSISTTGNVTIGGALAANGGVTLGDAAADALTITSNTATVNNTLTFAYDAATTNTAVDVLSIQRTSSGTPANGIGAGLAFKVETTASNIELGATIDAVVTDVTAASEDFALTFNLMTAGAAASEKMRIDSSGNVGIGKTNPSQRLDVVGNIQISDASGLQWSSGSVYIIGDSSNNLKFNTNSTERMRIDSAGNVGIGTSSPTAGVKLDVNGSALFRGDGTEGGEIGFRNPDNSSIGLIIDVSGAADTGRVFSARNNSQLQLGQLAGTGGIVTVHTAGSERMRIDSAGNVGIGVVPSANGSIYYRSLELGKAGCGLFAATSSLTGSELTYVTGNAVLTYSGGPLWLYGNDGNAGAYAIEDGNHLWKIAGSGTAGNAITFTPAMTLDLSGNLGIGTSSPAYRLDVRKAGETNIGIVNTTNSVSTLIGSATDTAYIGTFTNHPQTFYTNSAERMRIDSSGNLLVGTTSGNYKFTAWGTYNDAKLGLLTVGRSGTEYPSTGYNVRYSSTANVYTYDNFDTAAWIRYGQNGSRIETFTAPTGTAGATISYTAGPYVALGGTSWTNSSDERLKTDLVAIEDAANKVNSLRAVTGRFKTDPEDKRRAFVIAQDVQKVLPEAVDCSDPDKLGVQYTDLIPLLVAAIQEQQEQISQLKAEVAALKGV